MPTNEEVEGLLRRMRWPLRRVLWTYHVPAEDAEDLLQDAILTVITRWEKLGNREGCLMMVVRHQSMAYWRKRRLRHSRFESMEREELEAMAPEVRGEQERAVMRWDVARVSEGWTPRHRMLLWLRYREGLSVGEVAERLAYSEGSVRKISRRLIERLREAVGELPG